MSPERRRARIACLVCLAAVCSFLIATPASALRIVNHNITNYPGTTGPTRDAYYRTILAPLAPDIVVVQEMQSQAGVNEFLTSVLNTLEPGQWAAAPFINGNDTNNALFYRMSTVQLIGSWGFYPNPANLLRLVNCYRLMPAGYSGEAAELRIYSQHLKAGTASSDQSQRYAEAIGIRDSMNAVAPGTHCILMGDFNVYAGSEAAFTKLLEPQADNDGRLYDPLNAPPITWNTASLAPIHTQSPCLSGCQGGFSTGGLDDRFDMFLPTYNMNDGQGLELLVSTYIPVGNDGQHYNKNIIDAPTIPEGAAYASALFGASDHLPIRVDVQLPAKIGVPDQIALGSVIAGGGATLSVANDAVIPADALDYSFDAPAGFAAPAGNFQQAAGATPAEHDITTTPGAPGPRNGELAITSDDPDQPVKSVTLSAMVFDHAVPSLDSLVVVTQALLDFGTHASGAFLPKPIRVHNFGYDALQASLEVQSASIVGGEGRFTILGGFTPAEAAGVAATYGVQFNDADARPDSLYQATLVFQCADEALPGATPLGPLQLTLRAVVGSGTVDVTGSGLPGTTVLYAPRPNPLQGGAATTVRFDLAQRADIRLEIFDLGGRRVATLANGAFEPGRHGIPWNGQDMNGTRLGSGLYFVRLSGAGIGARMQRVAIVR